MGRRHRRALSSYQSQVREAVRASTINPHSAKPMSVQAEEWNSLADEGINDRKLARNVVSVTKAMLQLMFTRAPGQPTSYCNLRGNDGEGPSPWNYGPYAQE